MVVLLYRIMPTIKMLSSSEKQEIKKNLEKYCNLPADEGDLVKYVTEMFVADGDVEVRFFPVPESSPVEAIRFEVSVEDSAQWKEDLGSYSADNLRNGGPHYEQLAEELENIVSKSTGEQADFVKEKGSGAFTAKVEV